MRRTGKIYICRDCNAVFETYYKSQKGPPLCIGCGDGINVENIVRKPQNERTSKPWFKEDDKLLLTLVKTELSQYFISVVLDRSEHSVRSRLARLRGTKK